MGIGHLRDAARRCALPLGCVAALAAPAAAQAAAAPWHGALDHRLTPSTSTNWSGYSATHHRFTRVAATWKQPAVTCTSRDAYSSFWVGLDGDGSATVEQTGSEADCTNGRPSYSAWYEMYPKYPVTLGVAVRPGDSLSALVTSDGAGHFTLTFKNATTGRSFTTHQTLASAKLASAEVIAEAPSSFGGVLPLADFGTVHFFAARANGQPIGSFTPARITMASGGVVKAVPSALTNGSAFSVAWKHA